MINKNRDSKFIIYQVLYIFVITVLALKGADLDLRRVSLAENTVSKSVRDSLIAVLDSLYSLGIDFSIKIDPNVVVENEKMREQLADLTKRLETLKDYVPPSKEEPKKEKVEEQTLLQSPISVKQTFIQYTWNMARNTGSVPATIIDPRNPNAVIATIPPGQDKKFDLTDQTEVIIRFGTQEDRIKVLPNKPPDVKIERVTTKMNSSDIYVQELQRITVFKVTIVDQRPDQLKVSWIGPIAVNGPTKDSDGNPVYNVTLKIASTASAFDNWLDKNGSLRESDGRYKVNFFCTVVDERSKDRVQVGDSFFFTDFSK
jgi:hypothetical protein